MDVLTITSGVLPMTADQVRSLQPALAALLGRFRGCFAFEAVFWHLQTYILGLMADLKRKSVEPIALAAGVPVRVMVAPIIPGLTDSEIPAILKAVAEAGALQACHTLIRLPWTVAPVFLEWLARTQPLKAAKVESLIRQTRGGALNRSQWGRRMSGTGPIARQIGDLFATFARRYALDRALPEFNTNDFTPPVPDTRQRSLF